jgi:predicted ester cyclase
MTSTVIGEVLGIPGNGRRVTLRILHVFGCRDRMISREKVWMDRGAIVAQLTAPKQSAAASFRSVAH